MKSGDWTKRPHVDVMSDREAREQVKASKKKKRTQNPNVQQDAKVIPNVNKKNTNHLSKPADVKVSLIVSDSPTKGGNKSPNPPKVKPKSQSAKGKNTKFNSLAHKHSTGATNWQKFLAEGAEGIKKKVPTVKNTSVDNSRPNSHPKKALNENQAGPKMSKVVAMDCEMVGVGEDGRDSILARVSIVNVLGDCIYDKYVKPREPVTDYRTFVSGIREEDLVDGENFDVVQREVAEILRHRILVGHAIKNDLEVLFLTHPRQNIRDTAKFFRKGGGRTPSLKNLAAQYLDVTIQEGEHSSVQDAKAAVQLYNLYRKQWELGGGNRKHNRIDTYHNKIRPQMLIRGEDT